MDAHLDALLYERLPAPALDEAWLAFYTARDERNGRPFDGRLEEQMLRTRNRLVLHYAPIVKYATYRYQTSRGGSVEPSVLAVSLLRVIRGMMTRPSGDIEDWTAECVALTCSALTNLDTV